MIPLSPAVQEQLDAIAEDHVEVVGGFFEHNRGAIARAAYRLGVEQERQRIEAIECTCRQIEKCERCETIEARGKETA